MTRTWRPAHGKPLVCVHWRDADAASPTSAYYESEIASAHKTTPMETYGLLLLDDESGVTLMNETYMDSEERAYRGRSFILRSQIVRVEIIRQPTKRRTKQQREEPC